MPLSSPSRRTALITAGLAVGTTLLPAAFAQQTPIKFQLDGYLAGPATLFLVPLAKNYFRDEKLNVSIDAGHDSATTVARVASGAADMGFADMASVMEFQANNPNLANKPVAVMMVYNNAPDAVIALKKSGIRKPSDLNGSRLGAPLFDAGRRAWPIFARANGLKDVHWVTVDPALREALLVRGEVDAITGFSFTSLLNLEARGVKPADIVMLAYPDHGVKLYGNAIIAGEAFLKANPMAVKSFLRAFTKGVKDVVEHPQAAIGILQARNPSIDATLELRRLKLALDATVLTADARVEGFGTVMTPRLALMATQVSEAYGTKSRVNANAIWDGSFMPSATDRNIFPVS